MSEVHEASEGQALADDGTITIRDLPAPKPTSPVTCVFAGVMASYVVGSLAWRVTAARDLPLSAADATIAGGVAVMLVSAAKARRPVRWRLWAGVGCMLGMLLAVANFTDIL